MRPVGLFASPEHRARSSIDLLPGTWTTHCEKILSLIGPASAKQVRGVLAPAQTEFQLGVQTLIAFVDGFAVVCAQSCATGATSLSSRLVDFLLDLFDDLVFACRRYIVVMDCSFPDCVGINDSSVANVALVRSSQRVC